MLDFTGKCALVTGATGGIGRVVVKTLHDNGATVILTDMNQEALDAFAAELKERVFAFSCNLGDPADIDSLIAKAEKAAGAMAHYGNNALNIMRNQAEYCGELVEDIDNNLSRALRLSRELRAEFHEDSRGQRLALELEKILARADLTELAGHLGGVLEGTRRMTRIIGSLKKSAERPSLMRYALGQDVLKLEDDSHD